MATYKSNLKVRIVGILDGAVTVALLIQIICCTIYPLWANYSGDRGLNEGTNGTISTTPIPRYILMQEAMNSINGHVFNSTHPYKVERISSFWILVFLALVLLFGTIPVVAAGALVKSTIQDIDPDKAIQLTRFWMHCNISTFLLAALEFVIVLIMPILGFRVAVPIPTLLYLGVRAVFTFIVLKQLNTKMDHTLIATLDPTNSEDGTCSIREKTYSQD